MKSIWGIAFVTFVFVVVCSITSGQATKPTTTNPSTAPMRWSTTTVADPLGSPEVLADFIEGRDRPVDPRADTAAWDKLTTLQQQEADKVYQRLLWDWGRKSDCRGKQVTWVVGLKDVSPAEEGTGFKFVGTSSYGYLITADLPADQRATLLKIDKGKNVEVTGVIKDYVNGKGAASVKFFGVGLDVNQFGVMLEEARVTPTDKPVTEPDVGKSVPRTAMFGIGGKGNHVVYVIDRSGSMLQQFDVVRTEMQASLGKLTPQQDFHIIFFSSGDPMENTPKQLVAADKDAKAAATKYLMDKKLSPSGQTDPLPALKRAFDVLDKADASPGKTIYLLTDGVFPDNKKVIELIAERNAKKEVAVYTFLYGEVPPEAEEIMKKIAKDSGGMYKAISADE